MNLNKYYGRNANSRNCVALYNKWNRCKLGWRGLIILTHYYLCNIDLIYRVCAYINPADGIILKKTSLLLLLLIFYFILFSSMLKKILKISFIF